MNVPNDPIAEARRQWQAHGWDSAADGMAMVTSVARVHQLLMERIDAVLRPLDLTFARYEILRLLAFSRNGSMPMSKLGSRLQVHAASVTSAVNRLESQGHVERLRKVHDRRVILAAITVQGRDVVTAATVGLNEAVFSAPGLGNREVVELTRLLADFRTSAGDVVASPGCSPTDEDVVLSDS